MMVKLQLRAVLSCAVLVLMLAIAHGAAGEAKGPKPPKPPKKPKTVKCNHNKKLYPFCRGIKFECPLTCPRSCHVDCQRCIPVCPCDKPGGVCQDPRFIGGDGITFYFHGKKDRDFCLLTDSDLHINAHFIGKRDPSMTRDFTWVQSISILFGPHRLYLAAQKTAMWDDSIDRLHITYNNGSSILLPNKEGAMWQSSDYPATSITRSNDANAITVEVENKFRITANVVPITEEESRVHNYGVTEDDCLAHLELVFEFYSLSEDVDGVLGQTYREGYVSNVKVSAEMPVMGGDDRFLASDLYATDCTVARFRLDSNGARLVQPEVHCTSGVSGSGIVCKK